MLHAAAVVVFLVLGIACIATSCSREAGHPVPDVDRLIHFVIGAALVLLAIGVAGIELVKGGTT